MAPWSQVPPVPCPLHVRRRRLPR